MTKAMLIVDDEDDIRRIFADYLTDFGYEVHEAASGSEALSVVDRQEVEVVFLDLNLPDINGLQVCRQLKEKSPHTAVFAVTGFLRDYSLEQCKEVGFDDFFPKPVQLSVLHNAALRGLEIAEQRRLN